MSNIFSGSATEEEIKLFIGGRPIISMLAGDKSDSKMDNVYPFGYNINHPETGKKLYAVKGYCAPEQRLRTKELLCYYAEYMDEDGNLYYYLDSRFFCKAEFRGTKSIWEQQCEDNQELKRKMEASTKNVREV